MNNLHVTHVIRLSNKCLKPFIHFPSSGYITTLNSPFAPLLINNSLNQTCSCLILAAMFPNYGLHQYGAPYEQQFQRPQVGGLPWQAGRVPSHLFQGLSGLQQHNIAVGDGVAIGNAPVRPQANQRMERLVERISLLNDLRRQDANDQRLFTRRQPGVHPAPPDDMRNRQLRYDTLSPQEQKQQDDWAQEQIRNTGVCPKGFDWIRENHNKRYICSGSYHIFTDEALARGGPCELLNIRPGFSYGGQKAPDTQTRVPYNEEHIRDLDKLKRMARKKALSRKKKKKKGFFF